MGDDVYEVIQIGYGPVGAALALFLGRQHRSVGVCERWMTRYPLPRAVCVDHEMYRALQANGMGPVLPHISHGGAAYQWFNADWKELLVIDWSLPSVSGGPEVNFVHQPTLEAALDEAVRALPTVDLHLGWEAVSIEQDMDLAHVHLHNLVTGEQKTLSAQYVIGCDGANSLVRETIGTPHEDLGFEADWLVIDVLLKEGVTIEQLGIPAAGQYCNPDRPTTIVPAGLRNGRVFRRWEFMRLPGESSEALEREERVWELLSPWAGPDAVELVRHKVYNFRSLIAEGWRDRRLLLAGDAAHVMPPFMGQGMCSGMRDAWNLAWKLGLILDGKSDNRLLDTYEPERHPHVSQITDISIYLGKVICIPDRAEAAERDVAFLSGTAPPPPPFPHLVDGVLHRDSRGLPSAGAGLLSPHDDLSDDISTQRLDDIAVGRFVIVTRDHDLPTHCQDALATLDPLLVRMGDGGFQDVGGKLSALLDRHCWDIVIIRPDYYIYGGARGHDCESALVDDLIADLQRFGLRINDAPPARLASQDHLSPAKLR